MAGTLARVISTSTIRPASGDRHRALNRRIELSLSDVQFLWFGYIQTGFVFRKPNETFHSVNTLVEHLRGTLSLALDKLYPLAGHLVATEHDGDTQTRSFSITCSGAGATFVHAEAVRVTVADILSPEVIPTEIVDALFPINGILNHQAAGSDLPLLAAQVTELADGVFMAVSINHCAADGQTFCDFLDVWSELSRRDDAAIWRRGGFHFGREFVDYPVRVPISRDEASPRLAPRAPLQRRIFHFSKARMAELKAKANAEAPGREREISSLQALMAHLWVCITRCRGLGDGEKVAYVIAVSLRSRLKPPLPEAYVGTAVRTTAVTCTAGELLRGGMGWAAQRIGEALARVETSKFFYDRMKTCPPPLRLDEMPPNTLVTGGSPRYDVFDRDFGWGKPLAMRSRTALAVEGRLNVSMGAHDTVEIEATLSPRNFRALAADPDFTYFSS